MKLFSWPCSIAMLNYQRVYTYVIYIYFTCSRDTPSTVLSVPWERNKRRPHQGGESEGQNSQKKNQVLWVKQ